MVLHFLHREICQTQLVLTIPVSFGDQKHSNIELQFSPENNAFLLCIFKIKHLRYQLYRDSDIFLLAYNKPEVLRHMSI